MSAKPKKRSRSGHEQPMAVADCLQRLPVGARAAHFAELNRQLQAQLPPELAGQATLANIRDGRVTFIVGSSAHATRVRLQQRQLGHSLRAMGQQVNSIDVKVVQPERTPPAPSGNKQPLTAAGAAHLRTAAASLTDPDMRDRLLALASLADHNNE